MYLYLLINDVLVYFKLKLKFMYHTMHPVIYLIVFDISWSLATEKYSVEFNTDKGLNFFANWNRIVPIT